MGPAKNQIGPNFNFAQNVGNYVFSTLSIEVSNKITLGALQKSPLLFVLESSEVAGEPTEINTWPFAEI